MSEINLRMSDSHARTNWRRFATLWPHSPPHLGRRINHRMQASRIVHGSANLHPGRHARIFLDREDGGLRCFEDLPANALGCSFETRAAARYFADNSPLLGALRR